MFFPGDGLRLGAVDAGRTPENMRMPADHLVHDCADNIAEIEQIPLFRHARMEHDLEEKIAQLVLQRGPVRVLDGARDFIGLLDRVRRDGREVCSISHGQPDLGSRSRRMMSRRVSISGLVFMPGA